MTEKHTTLQHNTQLGFHRPSVHLTPALSPHRLETGKSPKKKGKKDKKREKVQQISFLLSVCKQKQKQGQIWAFHIVFTYSLFSFCWIFPLLPFCSPRLLSVFSFFLFRGTAPKEDKRRRRRREKTQRRRKSRRAKGKNDSFLVSATPEKTKAGRGQRRTSAAAVISTCFLLCVPRRLNVLEEK